MLNSPLNNRHAAYRSGALYYYHADHLGTTDATSNASGNFSASAPPDSFGIGYGRNEFTGREYDSYLNLHYYRARMYDPQLGRFISEDPIGFAGGDVNLYGYVKSNPVNRRDPTGLIDLGYGAPNGPIPPYSHLPASPYVGDYVFGDGGYLSGPTVSEFFSAAERSKRKCKSTWFQRFTNNFYETNAALPGLGAPSIFPGLGAGVLTSKATAEAYGSMTFIQWASTGFRGATWGASTFTAAETGVIVTTTSTINFILVSSAYETGVGVGSAVNASFGYSDYCPCGN